LSSAGPLAQVRSESITPLSHPARPNAKPVAELIAGALDPIVRKRGLARAELIAWWPEIVGATYAGATAPERIRWPRDGGAAVLTIRCDPALALQLSYETERVRERLNGYLGYPAVGAVRIVQAAVGRERPKRALQTDTTIPEAAELRLAALEGPLGDSLRTLGRLVLAGS
jgi:hypothetical protein